MFRTQARSALQQAFKFQMMNNFGLGGSLREW
jgi:hypothetical protein